MMARMANRTSDVIGMLFDTRSSWNWCIIGPMRGLPKGRQEPVLIARGTQSRVVI